MRKAKRRSGGKPPLRDKSGHPVILVGGRRFWGATFGEAVSEANKRAGKAATSAALSGMKKAGYNVGGRKK